MKTWVVLCLLMTAAFGFADSYWEGDAALQRGDASFESGLYAASNSFAPDTQLNVQNLENGKSTKATVSERSDGQSDLLILLSPKAADAIGIAAGSIARVRVTLAQAPSSGPAAGPERAFNPDSDVNPAAAYAAKSPAPQAAQQSASQAQQQPALQEPQPATAAQQPVAAAQQPGQAEQSAEAEDAQILAEEASRTPQKQLFLPPREDPKFAYTETPQTETAQAQQPAQQPSAAQGETPTVTGQGATPSQTQSAVPLAEAPPEPTPQEAGTPTPQPEQAGSKEPLALPQTGPAHAETAGASPTGPSGGESLALQAPETPTEQPSSPPATATPSQTRPGQPQVVSSLPKLSGRKGSSTFYVQLGAYATQDVAQGLAARFMQTYPVVVLAPSSGDKQMFKVLIGPLNKAESGSLLPVFKFRGFRDAFVRRE